MKKKMILKCPTCGSHDVSFTDDGTCIDLKCNQCRAQDFAAADIFYNTDELDSWFPDFEKNDETKVLRSKEVEKMLNEKIEPTKEWYKDRNAQLENENHKMVVLIDILLAKIMSLE